MPAHSLTCANVGGNVLAVFPDQGQPEGGPVFGKQRALYVTDKAARSVYRLLPQVVGLRLLRKIGPHDGSGDTKTG